MKTKERKPLAGLRILELANVLAGPSVGTFFAELGAEVLKIENSTTGGDVTRNWKLPGEDPNASISAYYSSANWGKKSISLNLKEAKDLHQLDGMVAQSDIVLTNFKSGAAKALKVDYERLKALRPGLLYGHISGFGPGDSRTAFDVILQAESGFMSMNGTPESGPVKIPVAVIDLMAAHQLKEGLLLALLERERTGAGALVSVSLMDAALASLANQASNWLMAQHIPKRIGTIHPNIAPYGEVFLCSDEKEIVLAVGTEKQFTQLCATLNVGDLTQNERFASNAARVIHRKALSNLLGPLIVEFTREELMELLLAAAVPVGAIKNMQEVFAEEGAQNLILREVIEGVPTARVKSAVFNIDWE